MKFVFSKLSPAGRNAHLSVLIFHRVLPEPSLIFPDEMHARRFDRLCAWLAARFNVLALDEAVDLLAKNSLPERAMAITFDDGYADNHDVAMPILQKHGLSATFFVATGYLDGGRMWNDGVIESVSRCRSSRLCVSDLALPELSNLDVGSAPAKRVAIERVIAAIKYMPQELRAEKVDQLAEVADVALPEDLMLRSQDVVRMRREGMLIGAHTVSHPILSTLEPAAIYREVGESKVFLERLLDEPVTLFAYPNGKPEQDYTQPSVEAVRAHGFKAAVSTAWGSATSDVDLFQLPRFTPWDSNHLKFGVRLAKNIWNSKVR